MQLTTSTDLLDRVDRDERNARAEQALIAFAEGLGLAKSTVEDCGTAMVSALVSALCHLVDPEDCPADVVARGLAGFQEQAAMETGGKLLAATRGGAALVEAAAASGPVPA